MRIRRPSRALAFTGALAVIGALAAGGSMAGQAARATNEPGFVPAGPAQAAAQRGSALRAGRAWTVTLVTGDVVGVRTVRGGPPLVTVRPGAGRRGVIFSQIVSTGGHIVVLPHDVIPLLGRVLDPALFDVTTLIENGDDDGHRSFVPLIVQGAGGASGPAAAAALGPSARPGQTLSSIGAVAVSVPKAGASQLGHALTAMGMSAVRNGALGSLPLRRVGHIWLDRTVRVTGTVSARAAASAGQLDHNLVQIGAPVAWAAGDTGRGVRIAVLDTGVDATHPDLRGQIVAARDFSASPGTVDRFGHGTFVAAQVAGTGVSAGGERRGVAFGARLVIGKVLGDDGSGTESAVIAGMQWAAPRARVVSMSLGTLAASDGTDPLSEAVNRLTAADHVLFVIAAGNSGPLDETVGSPGAATGALTVGAVDGGDRLAFFSSRGPRPGDFAIKPEITAPGVNIVGARAAGTAMGSPLDALYTTASGTSMATPQVAGAAAILAQVHPRWSPGQLRAALVSTAHRAAGGDTFELGGGVLDIGAAVRDAVVASQDVANLGAVPRGRAVSVRLSWAAESRGPVVVRLSGRLTDHAGRPAPAGAISLTARRVVVPAGGSAGATLIVRTRGLAGLYEGAVIAGDGAHSVRIPVGLDVPPPTFPLTLRATPLRGTAAGHMAASAFILDTSDPDLFPPDLAGAEYTLGAHGAVTIRVPAGHYWVDGSVDDLTKPNAPRSAVTGQPDVRVAGATTVRLDGAAAVPVFASVPGRPALTSWASVHLERSFAGQTWAIDQVFFGPPAAAPPLFAQPSGTAHTGTFAVDITFRLSSPATAGAPYVYDLFHALGDRVPRSLTYVVTRRAGLARVNERFYAVDGNTAPMDAERFGLTTLGFIPIQADGRVTAGSTRTDYLSTEAGIRWVDVVSAPIHFPPVSGKPGGASFWSIIGPVRRYAPGSVQAAGWDRQPFRAGPYSATLPSPSGCAPQPSWRSRGNIHVELTDLQDMPDGFDCLSGLPPWDAETSRVMRLYRNGALTGSENGSAVADFTVPAAAAVYRLTYADNTSAALPVSTRTSTTWTFRSAAPAGLGAVRIPLLTVGYALPLNLDNHPDGSTAVLSVARVAGAPPARITGLRMWTSTDNGRTWQAAAVRALGGGRYAATLPRAAAGQAVSLRVQAADGNGSGIDQTVMAAYFG